MANGYFAWYEIRLTSGPYVGSSPTCRRRLDLGEHNFRPGARCEDHGYFHCEWGGCGFESRRQHPLP